MLSISYFQEKGIYRIAVGIGNNIAQEELVTIAGNPDQVINADSFEDLNNQLDDIQKKTCSKICATTKYSFLMGSYL